MKPTQKQFRTDQHQTSAQQHIEAQLKQRLKEAFKPIATWLRSELGPARTLPVGGFWHADRSNGGRLLLQGGQGGRSVRLAEPKGVAVFVFDGGVELLHRHEAIPWKHRNPADRPEGGDTDPDIATDGTDPVPADYIHARSFQGPWLGGLIEWRSQQHVVLGLRALQRVRFHVLDSETIERMLAELPEAREVMRIVFEIEVRILQGKAGHFRAHLDDFFIYPNARIVPGPYHATASMYAFLLRSQDSAQERQALQHLAPPGWRPSRWSWLVLWSKCWLSSPK